MRGKYAKELHDRKFDARSYPPEVAAIIVEELLVLIEQTNSNFKFDLPPLMLCREVTKTEQSSNDDLHVVSSEKTVLLVDNCNNVKNVTFAEDITLPDNYRCPVCCPHDKMCYRKDIHQGRGTHRFVCSFCMQHENLTETDAWDIYLKYVVNSI